METVLDVNGPARSHVSDALGQCVVGENVGAEVKVEETEIREINPDRPVKGNRVRGDAIGHHLQIVKAGRQRDGNCDLGGHDASPGRDAGAAPVVGAAIIHAAAAGESDQRVVAVHLDIITIGNALRNAVEQCAGEVQRAVGIPRNSVNCGFAGNNGRAVWLVNVELAASISEKHSAVRQIEHSVVVGHLVSGKATTRSMDLRERADGSDRIVIFIEIDYTVGAV